MFKAIFTGSAMQVVIVFSFQAEHEAVNPSATEAPLSSSQMENLERLRLMGFMDDEENMRTLEAAGGSLADAVNRLIG